MSHTNGLKVSYGGLLNSEMGVLMVDEILTFLVDFAAIINLASVNSRAISPITLSSYETFGLSRVSIFGIRILVNVSPRLVLSYQICCPCRKMKFLRTWWNNRFTINVNSVVSGRRNRGERIRGHLKSTHGHTIHMLIPWRCKGRDPVAFGYGSEGQSWKLCVWKHSG